MKKLFAILLTAMMLLTLSSTALAATYLDVTGKVVEVDAANSRIEAQRADGTQLIFQVDGKTTFYSAEDGSVLRLSDVAVGDTFRAWQSEIAVSGTPARYSLHTMIVCKPDGKDNSHNFTVGTVTPKDGGVVLLNKEGDLLLTIPSAGVARLMTQSGWTTIRASDLKVGARIVVWYEMVAMSYPGQTGSNVALVLSNGSGGGSTIPKTGAKEYGLWTGVALLACAATLCGGGIWSYHKHKRDGTSK